MPQSLCTSYQKSNIASKGAHLWLSNLLPCEKAITSLTSHSSVHNKSCFYNRTAGSDPVTLPLWVKGHFPRAGYIKTTQAWLRGVGGLVGVGVGGLGGGGFLYPLVSARDTQEKLAYIQHHRKPHKSVWPLDYAQLLSLPQPLYLLCQISNACTLAVFWLWGIHLIIWPGKLCGAVELGFIHVALVHPYNFLRSIIVISPLPLINYRCAIQGSASFHCSDWVYLCSCFCRLLCLSTGRPFGDQSLTLPILCQNRPRIFLMSICPPINMMYEWGLVVFVHCGIDWSQTPHISMEGQMGNKLVSVLVGITNYHVFYSFVGFIILFFFGGGRGWGGAVLMFDFVFLEEQK